MLYMFLVTLVSLTHTSHFKWIIYAARWSFLGIFHLAQSPFWHREHPYVVPTLIRACIAFPQGYSSLSRRLLVVHSCKLPSEHVGSYVYLNAPLVAYIGDNSLKQILKDTLFMPQMWRGKQGRYLRLTQRALHLFTCPQMLFQDSRPKEGRRLPEETNFLEQQEGFGK